jgi:hypothetical protein
MTSLVSCCARMVNQNNWPTLLHDRADVTTRYYIKFALSIHPLMYHGTSIQFWVLFWSLLKSWKYQTPEWLQETEFFFFNYSEICLIRTLKKHGIVYNENFKWNLNFGYLICLNQISNPYTKVSPKEFLIKQVLL